MDIFNITQILLWIAVGTFLAIVVLLCINWYRNIYGKTPQAIDSEDNALNRQTKMFKEEMRKQELARENRAEDVKTALGAEAKNVKTALGAEAEKVQVALGAESEKVQAALEAQVEKVQAEFEKQTAGTKASFTIQREIVEDALIQHKTATQPDLETETSNIKKAIKEESGHKE